MESAAPSNQQGARSAQTEHRKSRGDNKAGGKTADGAGPGLLGTDPRPELRSADAAAGEIAADIGHPHHQQDQDQRDKSPELIEAHQHRCDLGRGRIAKSRRGPAAPLRREQRNAGKAERQRHKRRIDPSERETHIRRRQARQRPARPRASARRPHDRQPFHIKADRRQCHQNGPEPTAGIGDRDSDGCEHQRGDHAHQEIARTLLGNGRRCGFAFGHDPVFAARPPKRRSRLAYSAIAPSSAALSKSGQWIGTNTSSL